jgi:hypothetical protein
MRRALFVAVVAALVCAAPAYASLSMFEARLFAKRALGQAAREGAKRTGAEIVAFDVTSCERRSKRVAVCRGWSELSYPESGNGRCRFSVQVSETIHGGITTYRRLLSCEDV